MVGSLSLLALLAAGSGPALASPSFDEPAPIVSHDGTARVQWSGGPGDYELRLQDGERARLVYRGRMPSAHVSGLPNGEYQLEVRARDGDVWGPWSSAKAVTVSHHAMSLVLALMSLGLVTFVATAWIVLRAWKATR